MSDQLLTALIATGIALLCALFWGLSIAFVFWDVHRRQLAGREQLAWLALTALLPAIGFFAYLFARLLDFTLTPRTQEGAGYAKRFTALKRSEGFDQPLGTVPAAELSRETKPDVKPAPEQGRDRANLTYVLSVVDGPDVGREYIIERLPLRIGRGPQADVPLDDDLGVSRHHAEIYSQEGVMRIRDLKSTHGTLVNGYSIEDKGLDPGDQIKVGLSTLLFNIEATQ